MSAHGQRILFWGPQCVSYWNQYFCAPVYERLKPFGWRTSYFFPPVNEYGSGLNKVWPEYYPHYDPLPDYNTLDDLPFSLYWYKDPAPIADALKPKLADQNPDIIITRTNGHDYLQLIFPGVPIVTMGEAMGSPWFEQHCFSLSPAENFHGLPHLSKHPEQAQNMPMPGETVSNTFDHLTRAQTVPSLDMEMARHYFAELRKQYDRIYLFPADYAGPECLYLMAAYEGERFTGNADVIHHFKKNTDERTALLVTQHPLAYRQSGTKLSDIFHPEGRVIMAENTRLSPKMFRTSLLAHLSDGMIVRNSKSFWYAVAGGKPLLNLGSQALSAVGAHTNIDAFLGAEGPSISREEAIKIFYWQTTRQRVALRENEKISKMLHRMIDVATNGTDLETVPDLFEWGSDADYQASFEHCTEAYNPDFYFPK